jgi:hypothetical protein
VNTHLSAVRARRRATTGSLTRTPDEWLFVIDMPLTYAYSRFAFPCDCGQQIIVDPSERMTPTKCPACGKSHGTFGDMPNAALIPPNDASLTQMIRFSHAYNPIPNLRETLGDDYEAHINAIRDKSITAFRSGQQARETLEELLTCLAYEIAVMPYLGLSEDDATTLCRWFLDGIRRACSQ